jgi:hypothetical protein
MLETIYLVSGDNLPAVRSQLYNESGGILDISAPTITVFAKFRKRGTSTVLFTVECSKVAGGASGQIEMAWPTNALDLSKGRYEIEYSVSFNGLTQTVYDIQRCHIREDF